jgi:hypothetical protein
MVREKKIFQKFHSDNFQPHHNGDKSHLLFFFPNMNFQTKICKSVKNHLFCNTICIKFPTKKNHRILNDTKHKHVSIEFSYICIHAYFGFVIIITHLFSIIMLHKLIAANHPNWIIEYIMPFLPNKKLNK